MARMASRVRPGWGRDVCSRRMASAVVVSLVCDESISAMSV